MIFMTKCFGYIGSYLFETGCKYVDLYISKDKQILDIAYLKNAIIYKYSITHWCHCLCNTALLVW